MLSFSQTVKNNPIKNGLFFRNALEKVLGKKYELSLVFIGDKLSRRLNKTHRGINKPTDILSFTLDKESGEIFINLNYSKKKAKQFDREFQNYIKFLFIHGLFHLKGYEHSSRMESEEIRIRKLFNI